MRLRVVIFDDEPSIRTLLGILCARRGYEASTFPDPPLCTLHGMPPCPCPRGTVCADLLLVDLTMPDVQGFNFVEALIAKGCPAPQIALMSGAWSLADHDDAVRPGCRLFRKLFDMAELLAWFATVETQVAPRGCSWSGGRQGAARAASPRGRAVAGGPRAGAGERRCRRPGQRQWAPSRPGGCDTSLRRGWRAAEGRPERTAGQFALRGSPMNPVPPQELEYLRRHIREGIAEDRIV
jgi:DNA-binding response OmpR family regulator